MFGHQLNRLVCTTLNHLIEDESWAKTRLRPFAGSNISVLGLPFIVALQISEQGLFSHGTSSATPDVTLQLPTDALGRSFVAPEQLAASVKITGSVDIAEALGFVLRNLHWDVESDLAKLIGDIPAHRLNRMGTSLHAQVILGAERLTQNVIEFVRDESQMLVSDPELVSFCQGVDQLRDDLARLEQRIRRI